MSAFVVQDKTINRVVSYLAMGRELDYARREITRETGLDITNTEDAAKLGAAMFELNCNAVNQRYGENQAQEFRALDYAYSYCPASILQAYKDLGCWQYQCSEGDIPESSLLYATMDRVYAILAHKIVSDLPAYDKLAWG